MKPFHTIAVPHRDILSGKLTMEVFAADLWETYQGRAPAEYKDADTFFKKTYLTQGLKNLLSIIEKRVTGLGGDPVIQIQTPFGGGKTHALIAIYHKAKEWKAKTVVIVGTAMSPHDTVWGTIEKQLTGSVKKLAGNGSPGKEALREVLQRHQPLLILMDEVLEYTTKAATVPVKDSSLAAQTIAFMQELTEVAGTLEKVCVVVTLPSSIMEHYDEKAEKLYQQLQKVAGRVEKIYTPVQETEITKVIRRRLFSEVDEIKTKAVVSEFLEYAEKEGILPVGKELSEYREKFLDSYPFSPEVVEVLYHRWGSFPTFQRTRGVLRLLALVIHSLKQSGKPYITLADFDLSKEEIKRELIKHVGNEFDSVIAADITNPDSGAKKIDGTLGKSFQGLMLGTRAATSIFLYSFSGGQEKGAHMGDIKRSATTTENPSSVIAEAVEQLKTKLFYLQSQNDKCFFSNQPNLNRILLTKMENIKPKDVIDEQRELLKHQIVGKLKVFLWPDKPKDIPDTEELKLVILPEKNESFMKSVLETKGESPRIFRNTIFFVCPSEIEKGAFVESMKRRIAYEHIEEDKTLKLSEEQGREIAKNLKKEEENLSDAIRRLYRLVYLPARDGVRELDIGIPTYGERKGIDQEIYEKLRVEKEILERIAPLVIKERYLKEQDYVKVLQIYDSMLKTPGERRTVGPDVIDDSIREGVKTGLFGLGELQGDGTVVCRFFKEDPLIASTDTEVLLKESVCIAQRQGVTAAGPEEAVPEPGEAEMRWTKPSQVGAKLLKELELKFRIPRGKIAQLMGVMNYLQSKFQSLEMEIRAKDGSISEDEYSNKIKEALRQLGIEIDEE
jgi:predicted AAA+ superfamily ATPase